MLEKAFLDVRVLPWRPRARVMKAETLRENSDPFFDFDGLEGVVLGIALWLLIIVAAPLIVLVLAVLLFSVELPIVLALAVVLVVVRFTGLMPWTVVIVNTVSGEETTERYRALWRAIGRIRAVNADRRVQVRWAWV